MPTDLTRLGKGKDGWIYDCLFQEIDLATGTLLFQWRSSDSYPVEESYAPFIGNEGSSPSNAWDYFHINSIDKDPEGNYYISSRYMHTITAIKSDGTIKWILGGARSSFTDLSTGAASFTWQHHASWHANNTITVFDNGASRDVETAKHSRGLVIQLDLNEMSATLTHALIHPTKCLSPSQGSIQILPPSEGQSGNFFVGWGHSAAYTEYSPDGEILCDVHFAPPIFFNFGWVKSYRTFKAPWVGKPTTPPDVALSNGAVFVSWNGATEVVSWRLEGSEGLWDGDFVAIDQMPRSGFETGIILPAGAPAYLRIMALDARGVVLGCTKTISSSSPSASGASSWFCLSTALVLVVVAGCVWAGWRWREGLRRALCVGLLAIAESSVCGPWKGYRRLPSRPSSRGTERKKSVYD